MDVYVLLYVCKHANIYIYSYIDTYVLMCYEHLSMSIGTYMLNIYYVNRVYIRVPSDMCVFIYVYMYVFSSVNICM